MSASRAAKRRKLDDDDDQEKYGSSPAPAPAQPKSNRTTATYSNRSAKSSPAVKASTKSGTDVYFAAKRSRYQQPKKEKEQEPVDVYDDIEGANRSSFRITGQLSNGSKPNGAPRSVSAAAVVSPSKNKKDNLDPLRNQKPAAAAVLPVPAGRRSFGFFKQFHAPMTTGGDAKAEKKEVKSPVRRPQRSAARANKYVEEDSSVEELDQASGNGSESEIVDGVDEDVEDDLEEDVEEEVEENVEVEEEVEEDADDDVMDEDENVDGDAMDEDEEDTDEVVAPVRIPASAKRSAKMSTTRVAATKKPKALEDEIKELQEKARKEAAAEEEEDSEDELMSQDEVHTPSKSVSSQRKSSARSTRVRRVAQALAPSPTKPLDRRKAKANKNVDVFEVPESDVENVMDVDEQETDKSESETFDTAAQTPAKVVATPRKTRGQLTKTSAAKAAGPTFSSKQIECIQKIVLEKTTRKRHSALVNLDDEYAKVSTLIEQTVTAGESNSMLLIGARGSGKTALVNQILREQATKHSADFHAVRLNGFIHTDDKIALREIWRQLGREMELDEDESTSKNYADTMTKLLALLSHPSEMGLETDQVTKSVIFVLDEFELFAGHPRQTLLYNLFDIAQSRKAPIAVLGLTTKIDVAESLEKRVKSRFSHRYVHLSLAKSVQAFEQTCRTPMILTPEDLSVEEKQTLELAENTKGKISDDAQLPASAAMWNTIVDKVIASDTCSSRIRRLYHTTKSAPEFYATLSFAAATMPTTSPTTKTLLDHLTSSLSTPHLQPPDSKLSLLPSLSTLQLALLICAARLTNIYNTEVISFALAYEEYKVLASKARLQASASGAIGTTKVWGKDLAKGAWDELLEIGLVMEDGRSGSGTGRVDVALEEIGMCGIELGAWGKWCKEI